MSPYIILLGGINSYRLLRNVVEAEHRAENLIGGGGICSGGPGEAMKGTIAELGIGKVKRPEEHVYTLPKGVDCGGLGEGEYEDGWMVRAAPLTEMGDAVIVERLQVSELKVNFRVKVSSHIILDRSGEEAVLTSTVYMKL